MNIDLNNHNKKLMKAEHGKSEGISNIDLNNYDKKLMKVEDDTFEAISNIDVFDEYKLNITLQKPIMFVNLKTSEQEIGTTISMQLKGRKAMSFINKFMGIIGECNFKAMRLAKGIHDDVDDLQAKALELRDAAKSEEQKLKDKVANLLSQLSWTGYKNEVCDLIYSYILHHCYINNDSRITNRMLDNLSVTDLNNFIKLIIKKCVVPELD